jgi:hypothetical protein
MSKTHPRRRSRISEQFSAHPISMLESPAWGTLSLSARRFLDRLEIELAHHGGNDNGKLPLTYEHLEAYGMDRHAIAPAIREAVALGFVEITEQGRGGNAESRRPTQYRITYAHSRGPEPTHEWRKIKTVEDASAIADAARREKQRQNKRRKKQKAGGGFSQVSVGVFPTENVKSPVGVSPTTAVGKTPTTSRLSGRGAVKHTPRVRAHGTRTTRIAAQTLNGRRACTALPASSS